MFNIKSYSATEIHTFCNQLYSLGDKGREHLQIVEDRSSLQKTKSYTVIPTRKSHWLISRIFKTKQRRLNNVVEHTIRILDAHEDAILDKTFMSKNGAALRHFLNYFSKKSYKSVTKLYKIQLLIEKIEALEKKSIQNIAEIKEKEAQKTLKIKEKCEEEETNLKKTLNEAVANNSKLRQGPVFNPSTQVVTCAFNAIKQKDATDTIVCQDQYKNLKNIAVHSLILEAFTKKYSLLPKVKGEKNTTFFLNHMDSYAVETLIFCLYSSKRNLNFTYFSRSRRPLERVPEFLKYLRLLIELDKTEEMLKGLQYVVDFVPSLGVDIRLLYEISLSVEGCKNIKPVEKILLKMDFGSMYPTDVIADIGHLWDRSKDNPGNHFVAIRLLSKATPQVMSKNRSIFSTESIHKFLFYIFHLCQLPEFLKEPFDTEVEEWQIKKNIGYIIVHEKESHPEIPRSEGVKLLEESFKLHPDKETKAELYNCYANGIGVPKDDQKAALYK